MNRRHFFNLSIPAAALISAFPSNLLASGNGKTASKFRVSANQHYLVDEAGKPFFIMGDTPWFVQKLKIDEALMVLDDRKKLGYNSLLLELLDDSTIPCIDGYGNPAFATDTDITKPNQAFWDYTLKLFEECEKRGFFIAVNPIWYGWGGGLWMHHINPQNMAVYGEFLGKRFSRFRNIMWLNAGDRNPDDRTDACTRVLIEQIRKYAPHHLHTVHNAHEYSSSDFYYHEDWLDVNSGYTYGKSYLHILPEYHRNRPVKPVILCETGYEAEPNDIHSLQDPNSGELWTPYLIRRNVWWAVLSGACGYFAGSRLWRWESNWKETMHVRSSIEAPVVMKLFRKIDWWNLVPDTHHELVTEGYGGFDDVNYVTAALTPEGNCAAVYLPQEGKITVKMSKLKSGIKFTWFDPTSGAEKTATGTSLENQQMQFASPAKNAANEPDWVLVFAS
jgi:hypothetical protein